MKLTRISRIIKILTALQAGWGLSADELATMSDISKRTVFRDLKLLHEIGIPFEFDGDEKKYKIDPNFFLPPIDLSITEALGLLMLIHKAREHIQLPFRNAALMAGMKIESSLPARITEYCSSNLKNISVRPDSHNPRHSLDNIFATLQKAIYKKRKVNIEYRSLHEDGPIKTVLCPYHLYYNSHSWYVIGNSSLHRETRTFKLMRITSIELLDKCFLGPKDFSAGEYFGRAWSMIPEGKLYNIRLHFTAKVARNVAEVLWHPTQVNEFQNDGSLVVKFRVDGIGEISWWILGYGDQARVLGPDALRKRIAETAARAAKINSGEK